MSVANNHGSKGSDSYYTPPQLMRAIRTSLNGIELDVCSDATANRIVQAERYFTKEQDGLAQEYRARTVFCNPPGGRESLGPKFWHHLISQWHCDYIESAVFLSFSLDFLQTTQTAGGWPLATYPTFIFKRRVQYWELKGGELQPAVTMNKKTGKETRSAPKPSCLTLMSTVPDVREVLTLNMAEEGYDGYWIKRQLLHCQLSRELGLE